MASFTPACRAAGSLNSRPADDDMLLLHCRGVDNTRLDSAPDWGDRGAVPDAGAIDGRGCAIGCPTL
jgi:hypothetical protein